MQRNVGYCPQFDSTEELTVYEMLRVYALLRGLPRYTIDATIIDLTERIHLLHQMDEVCSTLNGANGRKLGIAVAMIGQPDVVILDEPTSGMDPDASRQFFKMVDASKGKGQTIIMSSHR